MNSENKLLAQKLYFFLGSIFITALVVSNLIFQKFFSWYPFNFEILGIKLFELSVGVLPYPITFLITDIISEKVLSYRAPGFSVTQKNIWVYDILNELGIKYDASIFPARRENGGFRNFNVKGPVKLKFNNYEIKEFPMSTNSFLGNRFTTTGGGYFRFFPYFVIRNLVQTSQYTMTYFHPRDFDEDQPMLPGLSLKRKFKSYYNISGAYQKFYKLIKDFKFIDIRKANKLIDWNKVPVVQIDNEGNCINLR